MEAAETDKSEVRTVVDYCRSVVAVEVKDEAILNILQDRDVDKDADVTELDKKTRDLLKADIYSWCLTLPTTSAQVKDSDGNWSHSEGAVHFSIEDKRMMRKLANEIYSTYDEKKIASNTFRICSGGFGNIKRPLR
jgi:hypothetical protein